MTFSYRLGLDIGEFEAMPKYGSDRFPPEADFLKIHANQRPEKPALITCGQGMVSFQELDEQADQFARRLSALGITEGQTIGLLLDNSAQTAIVWWAARRAGLYFVPISSRLTTPEIRFILVDSNAQALLVSPTHALAAAAVRSACGPEEGPRLWLSLGSEPIGFVDLTAFDASLPTSGTAPSLCGREIIYSSGTSGKPKGIRRDLAPACSVRLLPSFEKVLRKACAFSPDMVYLSLTPLYHATGRFVMRVIEEGGTAIILPVFDPLQALAAIEFYAVTHTQLVPTMFVRLLDLPEELRTRYRLSSLRMVLHAAAPCPIDVKRAMIEWFGPIVCEYYGGSENAGVTFIDAQEWLARPGSVGRSITGAIHIVDEGRHSADLGPEEMGLICFKGGVPFRYINGEMPEHDLAARGLGTYGDLGHVDREGYLYISDRRSDLIIRGGVNIYPREVEQVLEDHPAIAEVAVIGVADRELGQRVHAVVVPHSSGSSAVNLQDELLAFCKPRLARLKCPEHIHVVNGLPRNENGKLLKRLLREIYDRHD